jgi:hypothetical protein
MNPIFAVRTPYTPRSNEMVTVSQGFKVTRYGKEFMEEMRAKAAAEAAEAAEKAANTAPVPRKKLTTDDIAELASKYDPEHMSQEEYNAFLEDMVERGVLREDEIKRLGYHGVIVSSGVTLYCVDNSKLPGGVPLQISDRLGNANGNMLDWMMRQSIMEPVRAETEAGLATAKETNEAQKMLYDILEAIQTERGR